MRKVEQLVVLIVFAVDKDGDRQLQSYITTLTDPLQPLEPLQLKLFKQVIGLIKI